MYTPWIQIFSEKVRLNPLVITPQSYFLKRCGWIQRDLNLVNHISHWFIIQVKTDKINTNDMVKSTYICTYNDNNNDNNNNNNDTNNNDNNNKNNNKNDSNNNENNDNKHNSTYIYIYIYHTYSHI